MIFLFSPRCHLLLCQYIFDFTKPPSFVAQRYFRFHRDVILLALHDIFVFAQTPFAQIFLTPRLCGGATSRSLELKIMPPSRRPHQADVIWRCHVSSRIPFVLNHNVVFTSLLITANRQHILAILWNLRMTSFYRHSLIVDNSKRHFEAGGF